MPQFFLPFDSVTGETFRLEGPEAFHLTKVLRYREGQSLTLFDARGGRFEGVIDRIEGDGSVLGRLTAALPAAAARRPVALNLFQGLLKSGHWDLVLEKGTELGVAAFVPILTPRTVVLLREEGARKAKAERWTRVVMAAAKQSGRSGLPVVREPVEFRDAIRACRRQDLNLLAWEGLAGAMASDTLRPVLREAAEKAEGTLTVNLFIGPEGGFSQEEVELARSLGAVVFGLGPRILRAETGAIAAASLIQYELGAL